MNKKNSIQKIKTSSIGNSTLQYLMIGLGLMLYTFAWSAFLIPQQIIGGGVAGIASIIYFSTGVPVGVSNLLINLILLAIGIKTLGGKFGINTVIGIIIASLAFIFWQQILHIERYIDSDQLGPFMCAIIGAGISGFGIGTTFNYGGNSGGTDIIALIVTKYRNISAGTVILYIDIFIIISAIILPEITLTKVVYGYVVMFVFTYVLDLTIEGNKQSYQIMIFSSKADAIADEIGSGLNRGVTMLDAHGWYTKKTQKVIMVIVRKQDKVQIMRLIKEMDPDAFIAVDKVQGVFGKNFDMLK